MENKVRYKIGEIEFEAEGSAEMIENERNVFFSTILPAAVDALVKTQGTFERAKIETVMESENLLPYNNVDSIAATNEESETDFSRTSLASFLSDKGILSEQDFILMSAYYDEKKNSNLSFTSEIVKQYYADARRPKCSNISDQLLKLTQKGYTMDDPNAEQKIPKAYIITDKGMQYVEEYQPKSTEDKAKTNKSRKKKEKVESEYKLLNIDELNLSQYPDLKHMKNFKNQMILTMYIITKENKGEYFSVIDIQYILTDLLGIPATYDQINGVFKNNKLWFHAKNDENNKRIIKRKLLNGAKDFAENLIKQNEMSNHYPQLKDITN